MLAGGDISSVSVYLGRLGIKDQSIIFTVHSCHTRHGCKPQSMDRETPNEDFVREEHQLSMNVIIQRSYLVRNDKSSRSSQHLANTHDPYHYPTAIHTQPFDFFALVGSAASVSPSLPRLFRPPRPPDSRVEPAAARRSLIWAPCVLELGAVGACRDSRSSFSKD